MNNSIYQNSSCPRCGGRGYISMYRHVEGGVCFLRRGNGHYYKSLY